MQCPGCCMQDVGKTTTDLCTPFQKSEVSNHDKEKMVKLPIARYCHLNYYNN